ncbi:hypothetical protein V5O48_002331 [Marasmius crinis-equi]|uniref:Uncharacterized protein n=1 Tax=Marasmius crinis-equi TaxID=585013 RepID=A0ABR3FW18_9AGAR
MSELKFANQVLLCEFATCAGQLLNELMQMIAYSADAVYLYSTLDDPEPPKQRRSAVAPNSKRRRLSTSSSEHSEAEPLLGVERDSGMDDEGEGGSENADHRGEDEGEDQEDEEPSEEENELQPWVPVVMPRKRYAGARNTRTVKDVNFLGPRDEFVTSGSDDGNFFIWDKSSGDLHGIYEGDGTVVNVIEGHPHLPLIAVSGIDHTVKLFGPGKNDPSPFSRMQDSENIMRNNTQTSGFRTIRRRELLYLLRGLEARGEDSDEESDDENPTECVNQ